MTLFNLQGSATQRTALRCMVTSALVLPVLFSGGAVAEAATPGARAVQAQVRAEAVRRAHVVAVRKARAEAARRARVLAVRKARAATAAARAESARLAVQAASLGSATVAPTDAPATAAPGTDAPAADAPATDAPASDAPAADAPAAPAADANGMPAVSDGPWERVFSDDFTTDVPIGGFLTSEYKNRWMSYDGFGDTSGVGRYEPKKVLSVKDGALDYFLHTENGVPLGAAPVPLVNGQWPGQVYGRFSLRARADSLAGFGNGWLLWSNDNNWNDGEIDFAEGALDGHINAYNHCVGDPRRNCTVAETTTTWNDWHTMTVEWLPGSVTFFLDGKVIGRSTSVPTAEMHMVLQTATTGVKPAADTAGHVQIDWVTIDEYRP